MVVLVGRGMVAVEVEGVMAIAIVVMGGCSGIGSGRMVVVW